MERVEPSHYEVKVEQFNEGGFERRSRHRIPAFGDLNGAMPCDSAATHLCSTLARAKTYGAATSHTRTDDLTARLLRATLII